MLPGGRKEADGVAPIDVFGGPLLGVVFPPSVDEDVRFRLLVYHVITVLVLYMLVLPPSVEEDVRWKCISSMGCV